MTVSPSDNGGGAGSQRVVASFRTYGAAESAVDRLADAGFPVEYAAIVGHDVRLVEQVTGRFGYGDAAMRGALAGSVVGVFIGWLFAVFNWFDPTVAWGWLLVDSFIFGAFVGALSGLLLHAATGGRRHFASVPAMQAERYQLVVDEPFADEAEELLGSPTAVRPEKEGSAEEQHAS